MFAFHRFEVFPFCNSRFECNNTNMISHLVNTFTQAVNKKGKLPKYIVIMLESDIIDFLQYKNFGISGIYREWLEYLAKNFTEVKTARKEQLPTKAVKACTT